MTDNDPPIDDPETAECDDPVAVPQALIEEAARLAVEEIEFSAFELTINEIVTIAVKYGIAAGIRHARVKH